MKIHPFEVPSHKHFIRPYAQYRIKPHVTSGYTYASTQPPYIDPDTGKKKYRYIHWGTVDENLKFIPGPPFYLASPLSKAANRLKLNLYYDPVRRGLELMELDINLSCQKAALDELLKNKSALDNDAAIRRDYCYYKVVYDPATMVIESFELNEKKVAKARTFSGFFSIMTHGLDFDAMTTYRTYRLRDEQEKYFQQMKDQMAADRQRNWSEEGKTGRLFILFILFVSLILSSYVRHIWKSTSLHNLFSSSLDVVDEMRTIRCIEHTNRAKVITAFVGAQVDICEAFNFKIPDGCAPIYVSRQKPKHKRGRPRKKTTERDF